MQGSEVQAAGHGAMQRPQRQPRTAAHHHRLLLHSRLLEKKVDCRHRQTKGASGSVAICGVWRPLTQQSTAQATCDRACSASTLTEQDGGAAAQAAPLNQSG